MKLDELALDELAHISYQGEHEDWMENSLGGLILKINKSETEDIEDEDTVYRSVSIEVYQASEILLTTYRKWKSKEKVELVEFDSDEVANKFIDMTGKREELNEWIQEARE